MYTYIYICIFVCKYVYIYISRICIYIYNIIFILISPIWRDVKESNGGFQDLRGTKPAIKAAPKPKAEVVKVPQKNWSLRGGGCSWLAIPIPCHVVFLGCWKLVSFLFFVFLRDRSGELLFFFFGITIAGVPWEASYISVGGRRMRVAQVGTKQAKGSQ